MLSCYWVPPRFSKHRQGDDSQTIFIAANLRPPQPTIPSCPPLAKNKNDVVVPQRVTIGIQKGRLRKFPCGFRRSCSVMGVPHPAELFLHRIRPTCLSHGCGCQLTPGLVCCLWDFFVLQARYGIKRNTVCP